MWTEGKEFAHTNGRIFKVFVVPMHSHQHTLAGAFVRENVKYNTHTRRQTNVDTNQQHKQTTTKNTKNCDSNCYTISHHHHQLKNNQRERNVRDFNRFLCRIGDVVRGYCMFWRLFGEQRNNNSGHLYITSTIDVHIVAANILRWHSSRALARTGAICFRNAIGRVRALHRTKPNTHTL